MADVVSLFSPHGRFVWMKVSGRMYNFDIRDETGIVSAVRCCFGRLLNLLRIGFAVATAVTVELALGTWGRAAEAQEPQHLCITVPPVTRAQPAALSNFSIQVPAQETLPKDSFIRIRGLPPLVAVSSGYAVAPGAWFVPLIAAPNLTIVVPVGVQEKSDVLIDLLKDDGEVLAKARTELVVAPTSPAHANHRYVLAAAATQADIDPSPLAAIWKGFEAFLAKRGLATDQKVDTKSALSTNQKAEMFRLFLTWPQNPLEVDVIVRLTSENGVGEAVGTITVKNSEVLAAGRKEPALLLKPNLRGLRPGLYAFHIHENPNCGSALKDSMSVPGLAAGAHLWLSGIGQLSGTIFTSHLGDLPDLEVNADGTATKAIVAARLSMADVANRALIIHASQADNSSRMACGRLN
jgi:superoxide dismutase, Cu-Zn family